MTQLPHDRTAKLLIIGDSSVGKSSLLVKYTDDIFENNHIATLGMSYFILYFIGKGVDYKRKILQMKGKTIKLELWDTSGQEKFRSITKSFYRNCMGILLIFDLNDKKSFLSISDWLSSLKNQGTDDVFMFLVGNKSDLEHAVSSQEIKDFTELHNLPYFEASAKTGENIDQIFEEMTARIYERYFENDTFDVIDQNNYRISLTKRSVLEHPRTKKETKTCCS